MMDLFNIMHTNPILSTSIVMAVGLGMLHSFKNTPIQLYQFLKRKTYDRFVYTVTINEFSDLYPLFERWIAQAHPAKRRNVFASLYYGATKNTNGRRAPTVVYDHAPNVFFLRIGGRPVMVCKHAEELGHARTFREKFGYKYTLSGVYCRKEVDYFLQTLIDEEWSQKGWDQVRIFSHDSYGEWVNTGPLAVKSIEAVIMDSAMKSDILAILNNFKASRTWYESIGIPYKLTLSFEGPPGTGKTTLAKAIAMYLDRDIYYLNPSIISSDASLQNCFRRISDSAILLIEDIDAIFNDREGEVKVTFSGLLNCLDGVCYKPGLITCMTTNHIEKLDGALLRPGRTDKIIHVGYPKPAQIDEYMQLFYGKHLTIGAVTNTHMPMSEVQEICIVNRNSAETAIQEIIQRINQTLH